MLKSERASHDLEIEVFDGCASLGVPWRCTVLCQTNAIGEARILSQSCSRFCKIRMCRSRSNVKVCLPFVYFGRAAHESDVDMRDIKASF